MASTISSPEVPANNGRLFYCHQCSHQWRKRENSDYVCPQCREGFIEDVEEGGYAQRSAESTDDPIYSILHRIMSDIPPRIRAETRGTSSRAAAGRSRSRSPRARFFAHSNNVGRAFPSPSPSHLNRAFQFDMDDLMSSFLSTRSQPVSQRTLQGIPTLTIAQEQTDTQCSICFDEFKLAETDVRNLPCNHLFHERCIFPWLRINGTCPVCRARLSQTDAESPRTNDAASSSNFDNILRFMRLRRHARRHARATEPTTSSSSQTDQPIVPPATSSRLRVPPSTAPLTINEVNGEAAPVLTPRRRNGLEAENVFRRILRRRSNFQLEYDPLMPNRVNNGEVQPQTLRPRLRRLYDIPPPLIIDLTASDSERPMISRTQSARIARRQAISRSSSSSSSSSDDVYSSTSSTSFGPLPISEASSVSSMSSRDSDEEDFIADNLSARSPFSSSTDEE